MKSYGDDNSPTYTTTDIDTTTDSVLRSIIDISDYNINNKLPRLAESAAAAAVSAEQSGHRTGSR